MSGPAETKMADDFADLPEGFADFPRIWREVVAPQLAALEARRREGVRALVVWLLAGAAAAVAAMVVVTAVGGGPFAFFAAAAVMFGAYVFGYHKLGAVAGEAKRTLMSPALAALGFTHIQSGFQPPAFAPLLGYKLLPGHNRATFEDMIEGQDFALCEAHLQTKVRTKNGSHYVTVFRGLIGRISHPARVTGETVLARDAGLFNAFAAPRGMKRAGLGAPEFEKRFELFTTDQVEARYLVTPLVMQQLLALEAQLHGKKMRAAFAANALVFAVESKNLFEFGSAFSTFDDPKRMKSLIADLAAVRSLVLSLRGLKAGS